MIDKLHPQLLKGLERLPAERAVILLTRHSIREQPRDGFAGYNVPLTPEGVELARLWGKELGRPLSRVLSSPVGRCVDTATAMLEGAGVRDLPVTVAPELVEPGCFVRDIRAIGHRFVALGPVGFANLHFREPLPGIKTAAEGTADLVEFMRGHVGEPGSLSLLVTHDTILAAFIYTLTGTGQLSEEDWPWMMEGAFIWFDDAHVHWLWRGESGMRTLASLTVDAC